MCIDPPRPRLVPPSRAISSANIPSGSRPFARQCPWPRCVDVMTSAGPSGQQAPTAAASCPIDRWTKPGTSPSRKSWETRCSKPRMSNIRRCISRSSSRPGLMPCTVTTGTVPTGPHRAGRMTDRYRDAPSSSPAPGERSGRCALAPVRRRARYRSGLERCQPALARRDRRCDFRPAARRDRHRSSPTSSEFDQVEAVVALAVERFGGVDVLISNAGVLSPNGRIHNLSTAGLGARVPGQRARRGQRHQGSRRGHAAPARRDRSC